MRIELDEDGKTQGLALPRTWRGTGGAPSRGTVVGAPGPARGPGGSQRRRESLRLRVGAGGRSIRSHAGDGGSPAVERCEPRRGRAWCQARPRWPSRRPVAGSRSAWPTPGRDSRSRGPRCRASAAGGRPEVPRRSAAAGPGGREPLGPRTSPPGRSGNELSSRRGPTREAAMPSRRTAQPRRGRPGWRASRSSSHLAECDQLLPVIGPGETQRLEALESRQCVGDPSRRAFAIQDPVPSGGARRAQPSSQRS
jgi:hypothetical protein